MILCKYTACGNARALGMESGDIKDDQITASSFYGGRKPWRGRLYNGNFWAIAYSNPTDPWIQVDLLRSTVVTGIITQGAAGIEQWVKYLQIQYGDSEDKFMYILENNQTKVSI